MLFCMDVQTLHTVGAGNETLYYNRKQTGKKNGVTINWLELKFVVACLQLSTWNTLKSIALRCFI